MNVFITGEKGFIGRNLVKKLQEFGFNHVSSNAEFKTPNEINIMLAASGEAVCTSLNDLEEYLQWCKRNDRKIMPRRYEGKIE